jgi:hypothetical protein
MTFLAYNSAAASPATVPIFLVSAGFALIFASQPHLRLRCGSSFASRITGTVPFMPVSR